MMTKEQFEFDLDLTMGQPKEESPVEKDNKLFTEIEEALTCDTISADVAKQVMAKFILVMKEEGIDLSDYAAAKVYALAHQDEIVKIAEEIMNVKEPVKSVTPHPELAGPMHDAFMEHLKKIGLYADGQIKVALFSFGNKGPEYLQFERDAMGLFDYKQEVYGPYFRDIAGVKYTNKEIVKTTVYVAADTVRATGDVIEAAVTGIVGVINKYGFHGLAKLMELPVGRTEESREFNYAKDYAKRGWSKIKPQGKKEEKAKKEVKEDLTL